MKRKSIDEMTDEEFEKLLDEVADELGSSSENAKPDPRFTERHNGRTINGGAYSIAYYYDDNGNPCVKSKAKRVNIVEFSKDGYRINETYGILGR